MVTLDNTRLKACALKHYVLLLMNLTFHFKNEEICIFALKKLHNFTLNRMFCSKTQNLNLLKCFFLLITCFQMLYPANKYKVASVIFTLHHTLIIFCTSFIALA